MIARITWTLHELKTKELPASRVIDPDTEMLRKVSRHQTSLGYKSAEHIATPGDSYKSIDTEAWILSHANLEPMQDIILNMGRFAMVQPVALGEFLSRLAAISETDKTELARWIESRVLGYAFNEIKDLLDVKNSNPQEFYLLSGKEVYKKLGYGVKDGARDYDKLLKAYASNLKLKSKTQPEGYLERLRTRKVLG
jgi:hypothetical protein